MTIRVARSFVGLSLNPSKHIIIKGVAEWRVRRPNVMGDVVAKVFWQPSSACAARVFRQPPSRSRQYYLRLALDVSLLIESKFTWEDERGHYVTIASDHLKYHNVYWVFSSLLVHLVGTKQTNGCFLSSPCDPGRNFSHMWKIKACSVGDGWVCSKALKRGLSFRFSWPVIKICLFSSYMRNTKYPHAPP